MSRPAPNASGTNGGGPVATQFRSVALMGLFLIAIFFAAYEMREVIIPVVLAVLLALMLNPVVRWLVKFCVYRGLAAAIVLMILVGAVGYGLSVLAHPAADWIQKGPESFHKMEGKLRVLMRPAEQLNMMVSQVQKLAKADDGEKTQKVEMNSTELPGRVFSWTTGFLAETAVMIVLLFFLLSSGDAFTCKMLAVIPRMRNQKHALQITGEIQESVSLYLLTVTMINTGLGIIVGLAMWLVGMPNPALWGVLAGLMPFIPYVGAMAGIAVLTVVAFATFDTMWQAVLPPAIYLVLACLEGGFITPTILGKRLVLNPVAILLSVMFWGWLWGVIGSILAVPILTIIKILCDHFEPLRPMGEFLGA